MPNQSLANLELFWNPVALVDGVACQQIENGFVLLPTCDVKGPVLRAHQRRQLGQQELRYGQQVALPLHHAGELGDVGLQPVLLVVLAGGCRKVDDHFVDVVFQRGDFALRFDSDGTREIALGYGGRHFGNGADLRS